MTKNEIMASHNNTIDKVINDLTRLKNDIAESLSRATIPETTERTDSERMEWISTHVIGASATIQQWADLCLMNNKHAIPPDNRLAVLRALIDNTMEHYAKRGL